MGLKQRYNKDVANRVSPIIRNPDTPIEAPTSNPTLINTFNSTSLDLEVPYPIRRCY